MRTSPVARWTCRFPSVLSPFGIVGRLQILTAAVLMTSMLWSGVEAAPPPEGDAPPNMPPQIVDFTWANNLGSVYVFSGRVIDERPAGLTVTFGGVLEGHSATTDADGIFVFAKVIGPDDVGIVSASTVDDLGLDSNVALSVVY